MMKKIKCYDGCAGDGTDDGSGDGAFADFVGWCVVK